VGGSEPPRPPILDEGRAKTAVSRASGLAVRDAAGLASPSWRGALRSAGGGTRLVEANEVEGILAPEETVGTTGEKLKPLRCRTPEDVSVPGEPSSCAALTIEAGSEAVVSAFNTHEDRDPDSVLARPGAGQLDFSPGTCWLVVRHTARVTGGNGSAEGSADSGDCAPMVLTEYRRHEQTENAARAVIADLFHPRLAVRRDDVHGLRPGEAVAFERSGTLTIALDMPWSDIFASRLGTLAGIVGGSTLLAVQLPASARVRATARVRSSFSVVFARLPNGRTRIAVKKGLAPPAHPATSREIAVELGDPQEIQRAAHDVAAGVLGRHYVAVHTVIGGPSPAEVSPEEAASAAALAGHLGLDGSTASFSEVAEKLREFEGVIGEAIAELAAERFAEGVAYELARLPRGAVLVQAVLDPEALDRVHAPLCGGDLVPLFAALAEGAVSGLESYMQQRTLERSRCWGFTLGVGPWASQGRHRRTPTKLEAPTASSAAASGYLSLGAYEGRWLSDLADWTVDLKCDLPQVIGARGGSLPQPAYGLHLTWRLRHVRLEADECEAALDMAKLWAVISEAQTEDVRGRLAPAFGRAAEVLVQLHVDDAVFGALLPALGVTANSDFAAALAAAMPWRKASPGRADPVRRRELYGPLWARVLEEPDAPARALVTLAREQLADSGDPQLAFLEENYLRLTPTSTFVGLARVTEQSAAAAVADFRSGARMLEATRSSAADAESGFETGFALMASLWVQPHRVRALGALLIETAKRASDAAAVARTLTLVTGDAGNETAFVVAAPSA
jgi:hypothetical protein